MPMTMAEKIFARTAGQAEASAGEFVTAKPDRLMLNDMVFYMLKIIDEVGIQSFYDPDRVVVVFDHLFPAPSAKEAKLLKDCTAGLARFKLKYFLGSAGVSHQVMCEQGFVTPGDLVMGSDSHSTMYGALGAGGAGIGATEMVYMLATGELWFQVPETIRIELTGQLPAGVTAKDIVLHVIGKFGGDYARYKAVEYVGEAATALNMSQRMTIANMGAEIGAKFALFEADQKTLDYLAPIAKKPAQMFKADEGANYCASHTVDVSQLTPQVACPNNPENVKAIGEVLGTKIDQAYLGSCTNARLEDLAIAADVLKGKQVADGVRMLVAPASKQVMADASEAGYLNDLIQAGATILPAGCGACAGLSIGLLGEGEVCISSTNRNFPGRMGSPKADVFLASPAAVAAAAITGVITDPREFWQGEIH